ncbi:MAG TPA: hypothetical protein VJ726_08895 [Candidatus Limnocylindria bacterium]|nr:hypothetical protein [Candidatus Limnocylindria bacterium]
MTGDLASPTNAITLAALTIALVFAVAGIARWRGYDTQIPLLRAIADWVPGVSPFLIAIGALVAIPIVSVLEQLTAGETPNPIAAVAFLVLLTVAVAVTILTRAGAIPARLELPIVGAIIATMFLLTAVVSPAIRASVAGILFGSAALLIGGGVAYLYLRGARRTP